MDLNMDLKNDQTVYYPQYVYFIFKDIRLKVKDGKIHHPNINQNRAGVAISMSDEIDVNIKLQLEERNIL